MPEHPTRPATWDARSKTRRSARGGERHASRLSVARFPFWRAATNVDKAATVGRSPALLPIVEDDAFLADALEHASVPTLMMALVHLTGDVGLLRGALRPGSAVPFDVDGGMSAEDKAAVRKLALDALRAYRDRGCTLPPVPAAETIREMMSFLVGTEVPGEYVPMMLEEMALEGGDSRGVAWSGVSPEARKRFRVVVIGAGMSGILAAIRLEEAGIPYVVVEKNGAVGGTWLENVYPGCRVDVANHFYSYSFAPNHEWSEFFSRRDELHAYFERCATDYGIREKIRFRTEVVEARFDEARSRWCMRVRGEGGEEVLEANAVISAVGQLNRPKIPEIPGRETFGGPAFHSARWPRGLDLRGKRVAVVGTGASAFQLVPAIAEEAARVSVFQRSAPWMVRNPLYHARVSEQKKWLLAHVPAYARWFRFLLFWPMSDGLLPSLVVDPEFPHPERAVNELNDMMRAMFTQVMADTIGDDADLLAKVTPTYPPFIKRMLQDDGRWLGALKRKNVELVTDGITEIRRDGIRCADGASTRSTSSSSRPGSTRTASSGRWRSPGGEGPRSAKSGATSHALISASPCRDSRISSVSTARARTWRMPAASSSTRNARSVT